MGVAVPQVITTDRASNNQFIDGSLKFDKSKTHFLEKTFGSAGNRKTWTYSVWFKRGTTPSSNNLWAAYNGTFSGLDNFGQNYWDAADGRFVLYQGGGAQYTSTARHRDHTGGWYHLVIACDVTQSSYADRYKVYVNNILNTSSGGTIAQNTNLAFNNNIKHYIGTHNGGATELLDGNLSQVYFIDGQALGPEYFGFTDPLTNTWKPKKFDIRAQLAKNPNNGTTWSGQVTGSFYAGSYDQTEMFDGSLSSVAQSTGATWTTNIPFTTLRIYGQIYGAGTRSISVNGTDVTSQLGGNGDARAWHTITGVSSPLTSIQWDGTSYSGATPDLIGLSAIEIDGYILVDGTVDNSFYLPLDGNSPIGKDQSGNGNDWTPVNFSSSVAFDNPQVSGARPILNTTQGGTAAGVGVFGSKENKFYTVTTANGSVYQFDITSGDNPSLEFIRGATYRFDYTSHASHPLRFSSTNPDSSTTAYTEGTNTSVSNVITITVPHDAPDTLYYYCTAHASAMNGSISVTTDNTKADQYASNCVLALPLLFRDMGDVSASIACTSSTDTISNQGNATDKGEQSNFYNRSFYFDGSGDYVITSANTNDLVINTGDFTLEAWIWNDKTGDYQGILSDRPDGGGGTSINITNGNKIEYYAGGTIYNTTFNVPQESWHHVAFTRQSGTMYSFFDGVLLDSRSATGDNGDNAGIWNIGRYYYNRDGYYYKGYVQDARIYQGVAKYTSDFVVPATSPDILPDTPAGVSGSSKLAKITDGSHGNPNASGIRQFGNISVADSTDLEFGSGDFTLEAFIYYTGNPGTGNSTYVIFSKWNNQSAPSDKGFILRISDDGSGDNLQWFYTTDGSTNLTTTGSTLLNKQTWYHIAFVRNGSTGTFYIDGVADSTTVSFGSNSIRDTGNAFRIGANLDNGKIDQEFSGFISNVRVVKGDAVYTGNFTPPAAPLTSITNTKILACQDNDYNVVGITTTAATGASPIFTTTGDYGETYGDGNLNADSNASNLVLCLDFYANATDRMPSGRPSNQKSLSAGGDPDPGNTTTSHLYGKSAYFDGNDSYSISSSADFSFDGEFCVELWANASSWGPFFVSGGTNGIWLGSTSNGLVLRRYGVANDLLVQIPPYDEWVHLAFTRDGSNVLRLFINGEEQASNVVTNTYTQNTLYIGTDGAGSYYTGYIQDLRVYKGTAKYTSDFNPPFRSLNRVKAAVSPSQFRHTWYASGPVSFSPFNTDINTVRGQETGYCTWNALTKSEDHTLSNGNLDSSFDGSTPTKTTVGTLGMTSGKFYWESTLTAQTGSHAGIGGLSALTNGMNRAGHGETWMYTATNGNLYHQNSNSSYGDTYAPGDVIGSAFDADNGTLEFYKNGISQGTAATGLTTGPYYPAIGDISVSNTFTAKTNFGQNPFKFAPPEGFQPLNTANTRPAKVISRPDQYVGVTTYTGNGSAISIDVGHEPDFLWIKNRDDTSQGAHRLFDTVRGSNKTLYSSFDLAEAEVANSLNSFNSNGFTVGSGNWVNGTDDKMVAWSWKAGGSKGTFNKDGVSYATAADAGLQTQSGSGGGISVSACSIGTKQGFSIIKYGGGGNGENGIPHGLGRVPKFYIVKNITSGSSYWTIYHVGMGNTKGIYFDTAVANTNDWWDNKTPTEDLFYVKQASLYVHNGSDSYISYLWADVPGLQKFGSYTGNSNADGPYVELGFRPAVLMVKRTAGASANWYIMDKETQKINPVVEALEPNTNDSTNTASVVNFDFLSNGFKVRGTDGDINASNVFIYAAWAEAPSIDLYGGGANAR